LANLDATPYFVLDAASVFPGISPLCPDQVQLLALLAFLFFATTFQKNSPLLKRLFDQIRIEENRKGISYGDIPSM
jgi:hypothetical protein